MATVPGQPNSVVDVIPEWARPTQADFLQAAAIMHQKGKFQLPDQPPSDLGGDYTAKRWQGFESRFPKSAVDPEKARGTPVEPEVLVPSMPSTIRGGRQQWGIGRT